MPQEMYWHVEKRVIGTRFYGEVAEKELSENGASIETYIKEGTPPFFYLVDVRDVTKYPSNFKEILEEVGKHDNNRQHLEWILIVTDNRFINFIGSIVSNVFKVSIRTYRTMEEADAFMAHHAPEIAPALEARKQAS